MVVWVFVGVVAETIFGCSKIARKNENFFWSEAKMCTLYNENKISKNFCAILRRNQRC